VKIADVTFEMYMRKVGTLVLGEQIAYGLGDICVGSVWPWRLAANLAMAALLGRAGDHRVRGHYLMPIPRLPFSLLDGI
jgi:hypothetical protein